MVELKTLKDFENDGMKLFEVSKDGVVNKRILKQAAIEWVKDMEASQPYGGSTKFVVIWIKIFFGLTEMELEWEK